MTRVLLASLIALTASACAYRPAPTDLVHIVDSPADVRVCTRLAEVSPAITTTPGFGPATQSMLEATLALGGTHLYFDKLSQDWLLVRGIAYRCGPGAVRERVVIRAKG
ncbi:MAG: hypothetical protein K0S56_4582 [Microvirga sp.]|nr:hypothetical protein [Microvirga sp.]